MGESRHPLRKLLLLGLGLVVVAFAAIQAVPYGRDHDNPAVVVTPSWDSTQTEATFHAACARKSADSEEGEDLFSLTSIARKYMWLSAYALISIEGWR